MVLAHPDDGWVDRERGTVHFAYPSMAAAATVAGCLVALGDHRRWRLVRLVEFRPWVVTPREGLGSWAFDEVKRDQ